MDILDTQENLNPMVLHHEQQIKDIAAHLLELKRLVTPMMQFKPEKSLPEPVAWITKSGKGGLWWSQSVDEDGNYNLDDVPLYTSPKHTWVGLTDEEVGGLTVFDGLHHIETPLLAEYVLHIQVKLREKNGG